MSIINREASHKLLQHTYIRYMCVCALQHIEAQGLPTDCRSVQESRLFSTSCPEPLLASYTRVTTTNQQLQCPNCSRHRLARIRPAGDRTRDRSDSADIYRRNRRIGLYHEDELCYPLYCTAVKQRLFTLKEEHKS